MSKTLDLGKGKILKFNPKAIQDTMDLLGKHPTEEVYNEVIKKLEENPDYADAYALCSQSEGKTIWLEVKITDSFMSGMLHAWMFGKSKVDGGRVEAMGATIETMYYSRPSDFTDEEKGMIKRLYEKVIGSEQKGQ